MSAEQAALDKAAEKRRKRKEHDQMKRLMRILPESASLVGAAPMSAGDIAWTREWSDFLHQQHQLAHSLRIGTYQGAPFMAVVVDENDPVPRIVEAPSSDHAAAPAPALPDLHCDWDVWQEVFSLLTRRPFVWLSSRTTKREEKTAAVQTLAALLRVSNGLRNALLLEISNAISPATFRSFVTWLLAGKEIEIDFVYTGSYPNPLLPRRARHCPRQNLHRRHRHHRRHLQLSRILPPLLSHLPCHPPPPSRTGSEKALKKELMGAPRAHKLRGLLLWDEVDTQFHVPLAEGEQHRQRRKFRIDISHKAMLRCTCVCRIFPFCWACSEQRPIAHRVVGDTSNIRCQHNIPLTCPRPCTDANCVRAGTLRWDFVFQSMQNARSSAASSSGASSSSTPLVQPCVESSSSIPLLVEESETQDAAPRCAICLEDCVGPPTSHKRGAASQMEAWGTMACCGQALHAKCLYHWLGAGCGACPLCRRDISGSSSRAWTGGR
jgi:hypothetical protein